MHLSIIAETKMVSIKGISLILEDLTLPNDLISLHWLDNKGWEEKRKEDENTIIDIDDIKQYRYVIDAYNEKYAMIPQDQLPKKNTDLVNFIEEELIEIEIMRQSDEWEDFKTATNRA